MVQVPRVGRGVGALGVWGSKKWRPCWGAGLCKTLGVVSFKTAI